MFYERIPIKQRESSPLLPETEIDVSYTVSAVIETVSGLLFLFDVAYVEGCKMQAYGRHIRP